MIEMSIFYYYKQEKNGIIKKHVFRNIKAKNIIFLFNFKMYIFNILI